MLMPWAVCGYLLEAGRTGQAGSHTRNPPGGARKAIKGYHASVAKGHGPRGDLSGHLEGQSGPLGSMELWGFAYTHYFDSPTTLTSRCYYYPLFTDEETEALMRLKALPRSHS